MANQPKKYKKFVATAATATLVASAIVPVASAASLSDIAGNTHEEAINALVDAKVISGYPDGTFKPNKTLTRSDVVKLLGKYLETQGFEPAGNYKTSPAFKDLKTTSNEELLKYASVVKEAGVFAGSNGNLLAGDSITRENMAIVLVRMINTLKDVSLEEYVASQDFDGDVTDLEQAKAEARTAIAVLDFYDITNPAAPVFNPKGDTTRGQFASFLNKTINADYAGASATTGTVKAINNTTVEVTFGEDVTDLAALNITIEGLTISNKVVKQTDAKTVVLTTSAQEAGKEYTVTVDGKSVGKFAGISAVIPESVTVTTKSVQGTIGKDVTLKATVAVKEGQSKAGIPVTFNVTGGNANAAAQNAKLEKVVYTNADGVAEYTYTRYYEHNDSFVAYATSKSDVVDNGVVYWSEALTVTDVTKESSIANAGVKVYKVKSSSSSNGYVAVTFKENLNVAPNKVTNGVHFVDANVYALAADGTITSTVANGTPFEVTTGGHQVALVKLNAAGEAQFTLSGADATVTPVVYDFAGTVDLALASKQITGAKYAATDLQASATPVTFTANQTAEISIASTQVSAAAARNLANGNQGGREYTVTLKGKDGKVAPEGSVVRVLFQKATSGNSNGTTTGLTVTPVVDGVEGSAQPVTPSTTDANTDAATLTVDKNGQAKFIVRGNQNDYAVPVVYFNNGKTDSVNIAKLDSSDAQAIGEIVTFGAAKVGASKIQILDATTNKPVTSISETKDALIKYTAVDQNGYKYYNTTSANFVATFAFDSAFANYVVTGEPGTLVTPITNETNRKSYRATASNGEVTLRVDSTQGIVNFTATTTDNILAAQTGSIEFTNANSYGSTYTGYVTEFELNNNRVKLDNKEWIDYSGAAFKVPTLGNVDITEFEKQLSYADKVTYKKDAAGNISLEINENATSNGVLKLALDTHTGTTPFQLDLASYPVAAGDTLFVETTNDIDIDIRNTGAAYTNEVVIIAPNATVNNYATITDKVIIRDVDTQSFVNKGSLTEVEISDTNGSRFVNATGGTISGNVTITDAGTSSVILGGSGYDVVANKTVSIELEDNTSLDSLTAAPGATVTYTAGEGATPGTTDGTVNEKEEEVVVTDKEAVIAAKAKIGSTVTVTKELSGTATDNAKTVKDAIDALLNNKEITVAVTYNANLDKYTVTLTKGTANDVFNVSVDVKLPVTFTSQTAVVTNTVDVLGLVGTEATSSATDVLTVTTVDGSEGAAATITLKSVKAGTSEVSIKDANGNEAKLAVTVAADGKISYTVSSKYEAPATPENK